MADIQVILTALLSTDNDTRNKAEVRCLLGVLTFVARIERFFTTVTHIAVSRHVEHVARGSKVML